MRDRLVVALVGMTVVMIAMYGIPRAYLLADYVTDQESRKVERSVDLLMLLVEERSDAGRPLDLAYFESLLNRAETIDYVDVEGTAVRAGPAPEAGDITHSRTLDDGSTITVSRDYDLVRERIYDAMLPLIVIGLSLTVFAAAVGYWLARRLARPFGELAEAAERLSRARFDLELPRYEMREAQAIGSALTRAAHQLDELVTRERQFAANASHQLRTPITALRLTLEDLTMWPETPPGVAAELNANISELDRLSSAITELLDLSRGRHMGELVDVDLTALLHDVEERWTPQLEGQERSIVVTGTEAVPATLIPGPVLQILDVLVENACKYGTGRITLQAREEEGRYPHVAVADEGTRTFGAEVFQRGVRGSQDAEGSGLGLPIAVELATALGGFLSLADSPTTAFVLVLPVSVPVEPVST